MKPQKLEEKISRVNTIRDYFSACSSAVFLDFRDVNVALVSTLRERFREHGVRYQVVKNSSARRAFGDLQFEASWSKQALVGPTGVAWSFDDPSAAAKVVKAFRKEGADHEKLTIKCALLDRAFLSAEEVESQLAELPGKDELRSQLLATLLAPAQSFVRQLQAPAQNLAYVLDAHKRQLE